MKVKGNLWTIVFSFLLGFTLCLNIHLALKNSDIKKSIENLDIMLIESKK